ncbi:MAG: DUF222 domain-containing protein [Actinomycetales bacterium]
MTPTSATQDVPWAVPGCDVPNPESGGVAGATHPVLVTLGEVGQAVDLLAAKIEAGLGGLTDEHVDRVLVGVHRVSAKVEAVRLGVARASMAREPDTARGHCVRTRSVLSGPQCRRDRGAAHADVRAAALLDPVTGVLREFGRALAAGDVTPAHVEVARRTVAKLPARVLAEHGAELDTLLTEHARTWSPRECARLAAHLVDVLDPERADRLYRQACERRALTVVQDSTGITLLRGQLDPANAAIFTTVLDHLLALDHADPHRDTDGSQNQDDEDDAGDDGRRSGGTNLADGTDRADGTDPASATDEVGGTDPVATDPAEDRARAGDGGVEVRSLAQRRADALVRMAQLAAEHLALVTGPDGLPRIEGPGGLINQRPARSVPHVSVTLSDASPPSCDESDPAESDPAESGPAVADRTESGRSDPRTSALSTELGGGDRSGEPAVGHRDGSVDLWGTGPPDAAEGQATPRNLGVDAADGLGVGPGQGVGTGQGVGPDHDVGTARHDGESGRSVPCPVTGHDAMEPAGWGMPTGHGVAPGWVRSAGWAATGPDSRPIPASMLALLLCDAVLDRITCQRTGRVLAMHTTGRLATPAQTAALTARDGGCVFPGCAAPPSICQVHHVRFWSHGGPTHIDNLALLCWRHHQQIHHDAHPGTPTGTAWRLIMRDGLPYAIPPAVLDPTQRPRRNTLRTAITQTRAIAAQLTLPTSTGRHPPP